MVSTRVHACPTGVDTRSTRHGSERVHTVPTLLVCCGYWVLRYNGASTTAVQPLVTPSLPLVRYTRFCISASSAGTYIPGRVTIGLHRGASCFHLVQFTVFPLSPQGSEDCKTVANSGAQTLGTARVGGVIPPPLHRVTSLVNGGINKR